MNFQHKEFASGKWREMSLAWQMANIGSEVFRAIKSKQEKKEKSFQLAFERALELFDLTLQDPKNSKRLREVARARELFVDYMFDNQYNQTPDLINNYFLQFNYLVRKGI